MHCIVKAIHLKLEQPRHEADHLLMSTVKVKNVQRFTTTASAAS